MAKRYVKPTIENVPLPLKPEGAKRSPEEAFKQARQVLKKRKEASEGKQQSRDNG